MPIPLHTLLLAIASVPLLASAFGESPLQFWGGPARLLNLGWYVDGVAPVCLQAWSKEAKEDGWKRQSMTARTDVSSNKKSWPASSAIYVFLLEVC